MLTVLKVVFIHWAIFFFSLLPGGLMQVKGGTTEYYLFILLPFSLLPVYYCILLRKGRKRHSENAKLCTLFKILQALCILAWATVLFFMLLIAIFPDPIL